MQVNSINSTMSCAKNCKLGNKKLSNNEPQNSPAFKGGITQLPSQPPLWGVKCVSQLIEMKNKILLMIKKNRFFQ